jgi:Zn finger protein HypA/HybF involved in hydrogenase expression
MHEMGIASSILEAAATEALRYPGHRVAKVGVSIGEYAGVDTESLRFCFEAITKSAQAESLELDITWRLASDELTIAYLELEEDSYGQSGNSEESLKRERSNRGAAA